MSNVPEARARITAVLNAYLLPDEVVAELSIILKLLVREPPVQRAPTKHRPLSARAKEEIDRRVKLFPPPHLSDLAAEFNVNPGRVSEYLALARRVA